MPEVTEYKLPEWLPQYVRTIADGLGLKDWTFEVGVDQPDGDRIAFCNRVRNRKLATIGFRPRFFEETRESQRIAVIHELIHCHLGPIRDVLEDEIHASKALSQWCYNMAWETMLRADEWATDAISSAIACHYPLPPEAEPETPDA